MQESFFPKIEIADFLFEVKYDGPSFVGSMEIESLLTELDGFNICIKEVIAILRKTNKIKLQDTDFEILIEAPTKGSFKKIIRIVIKRIEKHPVTVFLIVSTMGGILQIILHNTPEEIKEMNPKLMHQIKDEVSISLLQDEKFLQGLANIASPLKKDGDKLYIQKPIEEPPICIDFSKKQDFFDFSGEQ